LAGVVTSGKIAAVLVLFGLLGPLGYKVGLESPYVIATLVALGAWIGCALYLAGREHYQGRLRLAEKLKPQLSIRRVAKKVGDRWRIVVQNVSERTVRFSARLESIDPMIENYQVPAFLQVTGTPPPHRQADIPGKGEALIDLCTERFDAQLQRMVFVSAEHPAGDILVPRTRYTVLVSAFPVPPDVGNPTERRFYLIPQPDGSMILSDAGG
jgi:hypothetical protein